MAGRDVVFTYFGITWSSAFQRQLVMPEDRLGAALAEHPAIDRLLVCDPYRSVAVAPARPTTTAPFPSGPRRRLHRPLRIRRSDPADPARAVARYEATVRRAAAGLGLERPAVITANPLFAGLGRFDWAGPGDLLRLGRLERLAAARALVARLRGRVRGPAREPPPRLRDLRRRARADRADRPRARDPQRHRPGRVGRARRRRPTGSPRSRGRACSTTAGSTRGIDVGQARAVAEAFPHGSLTFLGPVADPARFASLERLPNVHFHGWVPREETNRVIAAADAGLVPHVRTPLTEAMSPLKLYEYLAAGLPVAAADLPPIRGVDERVVLGPVGGDLAPAVRRALELGHAPEARAPGVRARALLVATLRRPARAAHWNPHLAWTMG